MELYEVELRDGSGFYTVYQAFAAEDEEEAKEKAQKKFKDHELKVKQVKKLS